VVIEIDGSSHEGKADYDAQRDAFLIGLGLTVLHVTDGEVLTGLSSVMDFFRNHSKLVSETTPPCGHPSTRGE
jgi:very-short-patch-repair endonuclease